MPDDRKAKCGGDIFYLNYCTTTDECMVRFNALYTLLANRKHGFNI